MIDSAEKAIRVQSRRRALGLKGRSKAVRRWFKRQGWRAIEAYGGQPPGLPTDWRRLLDGDFTGCRGFTEVYHPQIINRAYRHNQKPVVTPMSINYPSEEAVMRVLQNKSEVVMEISRGQ